MISKQRLLEIIRDGLRTEESAVDIYYSHIPATLRWLDLDDEARDTIGQSLAKMASDSRKHKEKMEGLLRTIQEDKRDAF